MLRQIVDLLTMLIGAESEVHGAPINIQVNKAKSKRH
jgi:hypothetical protein